LIAHCSLLPSEPSHHGLSTLIIPQAAWKDKKPVHCPFLFAGANTAAGWSAVVGSDLLLAGLPFVSGKVVAHTPKQ
jgi:hypothetical protein